MEKSKRSRKKFILEQGATCNNWNWSWSFVNHAEKTVIFGAWDIHLNSGKCLILSTRWERNFEGKKSKGYSQSLDHIKLVQDEGYALKTFPQIYSEKNKNEAGFGPAKMDGFLEDLKLKTLERISDGWYACDLDSEAVITEEVKTPEKYIEGASKIISVNAYERNAKARDACIAMHGCHCNACGFDFEKVYGSIGKNYIHVHHIVPLHEIKREYSLNPETDLVPLCPNCHAIVHRTTPALTMTELKECLKAIT